MVDPFHHQFTQSVCECVYDLVNVSPFSNYILGILLMLLSKATYNHSHIHTPTAESTSQGDSSQLLRSSQGEECYSGTL